MPNYSITINSKFRPFSYAEMLAPVQAMTQAHQVVEDQYSDLMTKASVWENMANEQNDPRAYAMYKSYADKLMLAADDLNRNGLTAQSRPNLMALKAGYASHIAPIEVAYKSREEQRKLQEQLRAQNPDLIFSREAGATSLDAYIKNPQLSYNSINGDSVRKSVLQQAAAIAQEPGLHTLQHIAGNKDYYEYIQKFGKTADAVLAAIQDNPNADKILTELVNNAVGATGVRDWRTMDGSINEGAIKRVTDYAKEGLWGAIGKTTYQLTEDWRSKENKQLADRLTYLNASTNAQMKAAREQAEINRLAQLTPLEDSNGNLLGYIDSSTGRTLSPTGAYRLSTQEERELGVTPSQAPGGKSASGTKSGTSWSGATRNYLSLPPSASGTGRKFQKGDIPQVPLTAQEQAKRDKINEKLNPQPKDTDPIYLDGTSKKVLMNTKTWGKLTGLGFVPVAALTRHDSGENFLGLGRDTKFWQASTRGQDLEHTTSGSTNSPLYDKGWLGLPVPWRGDTSFDLKEKAKIRVLSDDEINTILYTHKEGPLLAKLLSEAGYGGGDKRFEMVEVIGRNGRDYVIGYKDEENAPIEGFKAKYLIEDQSPTRTNENGMVIPNIIEKTD